jgi:purine-binding chemotaxis protein CheW
LHTDISDSRQDSSSDKAVQSYIDSLMLEAALPKVTDLVSSSLEESLDVTPVSKQSAKFIKQLELAQRQSSKSKISDDLERAQQIPNWAMSSFSCLSFKVAGLKLAVPVRFIRSMEVLELEPVNVASNDENDSVNGIVLGTALIPEADQNLVAMPVLNTAKVVMPERYDVSMTESYRHVLTFHHCAWALAIDVSGGEIQLSSKQIRWRSAHTRREWLAGTVVDKMCALIDIDVLDRQMLANTVLQETD